MALATALPLAQDENVLNLLSGRLGTLLLVFMPACVPRPCCCLAEVLAARLAAAGAIFEDALPAASRQRAAEAAQQRTMRQGGSHKRSESDEDSDFD